MKTYRCRQLAHEAAHGVYRCPTGMRAFHYHAVKTYGPLVLATMQRICEHRHREQSGALKCFEKGN